MTDDRNCHGQLTSCDRKMRDSNWDYKDYSMYCFTKFLFKIQFLDESNSLAFA